LGAVAQADLDAHPPQELYGRLDVVELRDVRQYDRTPGEQRAGENRQRRVLRAGDLDVAFERDTAADLELIHWRALDASRRVPARIGSPRSCGSGGRRQPPAARHSSGV